ATSTTTTSPTPTTTPQTFEDFSQAKNPFLPLVPTGTGTETGTGSTAPPSTGGTGTGDTTEPTAPPSGGTGSDTGSTPTRAPGGAANEPRPAQHIALLDVYELNGHTVANVEINGTVYQAVGPGDVFAGSYKVVSLSGTCGDFLFGDEPFHLCEGEEILK